MRNLNGDRARRRSQNPNANIKVILSVGGLLYICWFWFSIRKLESLKHNNSYSSSTFKLRIDKDKSSTAIDTREYETPAVAIIGAGPRLKLHNFHFDRQNSEDAAAASSTRYKIMTAYIEKTVSHEIAGTRFRGTDQKNDDSVPPKYFEPLPLRLTTPNDLVPFEYPKVNSCHQLTTKLPVDAGLQLNPDGSRVFPNVNSKRYDFNVMEEAKFCPVDADPFLPWIHDVFPNRDGTKILFIAQNKRRCNTGSRFHKILERLEPQVTLMQPVGLKRIGGDIEAQTIAPSLWIPNQIDNSFVNGMDRYRLASYEDSDEDSKFTRYICRFHTREYEAITKSVYDVIIGETFSEFPFNYEFVSLRKRKPSMLSIQGKDNGMFWLSSNRFECPVPDNGNLREAIASGLSVLPDGTASIYVDIIPIRTAPRFGYENSYFSENMTGPDWFKNLAKRPPAFPMLTNRSDFGFLADKVFGAKHVLPRVEASGRLTNIPICQSFGYDKGDIDTTSMATEEKPTKSSLDSTSMHSKPYTLTACVWAASSFHTRGGDRNIDDTKERIREWIEYHLMVGFDHIYVYDNSLANTNDQSLIETLSIFTRDEVTRVEWPYVVCNNNLPAHENTGERSSQYAAEASCRERYGQYTEWMASFDPDEYFVPQGKFSNMKDVLNKVKDEGLNILSFKSTRAYPDFKHTIDFGNGGECGTLENPLCRAKKEEVTYLETYNCEFTPLPKPDWADRAKKQIYRPDYVLSHYVHYSTITKGILETYSMQKDKKWDYWYREPNTSERFSDELNEAVMIHSKTTVPGNTKGFQKTCKHGEKMKWNEKCRLGFEIPNNNYKENATTSEGYVLNCYKNQKVSDYFVPMLKRKLRERIQHNEIPNSHT